MRQLLVRGSYGDTVLLQLIAANCDSAQFAALVQLLVFLLSVACKNVLLFEIRDLNTFIMPSRLLQVRGQRLDDSYVSQQLALGKKNDLFQVPESVNFCRKY